MTKYEKIAELEKQIAIKEKEVTRLDTEQMAVKILLNSLYGSLANRFFRYFDLQLAEGITLTGQLVIRWAEQHTNKWLSKFLKDESPKDRVIAVDTDSLYINVDDIIDKFQPNNPVDFLDKFGKEAVEPMLDKAFKQLGHITNAYKNTMVMSRECIADRGVWCCHPDTIIESSHPTAKTIEDLYNYTSPDLFNPNPKGINVIQDEIKIKSYDLTEGKICVDKIVLTLRKWYDGPMMKLTLPSGNVLHVTPEHKVLTQDPTTKSFTRWIKAGQLTENDILLEC